MVAGNTNVVATASYCHRQYWLMRHSQLYFTLQNTWTYPNAQAYVERLFREAPDANCRQGQLAVITNITGHGSSYHVAEELALAAGMHLVLLSRRKEKLRSIEENLLRECKRRGLQQLPTLFKVHYDPNSLKSVQQAALDVKNIAVHYNDQVSMLLHNPSGVTVAYQLDESGVEINLGRNFVATHVLTQQLLPLLKAAATPAQKPRIVYVTSVGHCQGNDFDPHRFLATPEEGGAPEGILVAPGQQQTSGDYAAAVATDDDSEQKKDYVEYQELDGPVTMYYRAHMANIANCRALAREEPSLAAMSVYPGSVASGASKKKALGIAETIYQTGFYMFNLSPRQGARASLRAALDPDIDSGALPSGSYLHCNGNPWTVADPIAEDPVSGVSYDWADYAPQVRECVQKLSANLLLQQQQQQQQAMEQEPQQQPEAATAVAEEAPVEEAATKDAATKEETEINSEAEINLDPEATIEDGAIPAAAEENKLAPEAVENSKETPAVAEEPTRDESTPQEAEGDLLLMGESGK